MMTAWTSTPPLRGRPTTAQSLDGRVGAQDRLDVLREDVAPIREDDHLLLPAAQPQRAARAALAKVAGPVPAVLKLAAVAAASRQ